MCCVFIYIHGLYQNVCTIISSVSTSMSYIYKVTCVASLYDINVLHQCIYTASIATPYRNHKAMLYFCASCLCAFGLDSWLRVYMDVCQVSLFSSR